MSEVVAIALQVSQANCQKWVFQLMIFTRVINFCGEYSKFQLIIQHLLWLSDAEFKFKKLVNFLLAEELHLDLRDAELSQTQLPVISC